MKTFREVENDLDKLAETLARNLVTNSFPIAKAKAPIRNLMKNGAIMKEERTRNVLVIGAGASFNVNSKIPLATGAIGIIRAAFQKKYGDKILIFVDRKVQEVSETYGLNPDEFETQMLACSSLDNELVLKQLTVLYNSKYPVSLFYEIVAHLFKHRFIDVIINFNFDEMLDNAIAEEMLPNQYRFIYSDGHCPERMNDLLHDNRLSCPIYIKPHGTISHPNTLKFTREAYYKGPTRIKETIIYLIRGINAYSTVDEHGQNREQRLPVNLIVAGFGMKSIEFSLILSKYLEKDRGKLYYFDVLGNDTSVVDKLPKDLNSFTNENSYLFPILHRDFDNRRLDDWFLQLWTRIRDSFIESCQPKDITRHVVLHHLFNPSAGSLRDGSYSKIDYFRDRTIIEIAMEILSSSDGLINLVQIQESRVRKYFSLYKEESKSDKSLFDFLRLFNLKVYKDYLKDTWYYNTSDLKFKEDMRRIITESVSGEIRNTITSSRDNPRFKEYLNRLYAPKKLFLNVHTTVKDDYVSLFQNHDRNDVLDTDVKWIYFFQQYFISDKYREKWNLVLSISETGGIFSRPEISVKMAGKKLMLIAAYDANMHRQDKREELLNVKLRNIRQYLVDNHGHLEVRMLPFREHNQHVVLFVNIENAEMELIGGIYYSRRHMSKRVTPVHVHDKDDLNELFAVFANYWDRVTKLDDLELIKEAVRAGNVTPHIQALASRPKIRRLEEIKAEIIRAFYSGKPLMPPPPPLSGHHEPHPL